MDVSEPARSKLCILVLAGVHGECGVALRLIGGNESGVEVDGVDNARFVLCPD